MITSIFKQKLQGGLSRFRQEDGVAAMEYSLVIAGVVTIMFAVFSNGGIFSEMLNTVWTTTESAIIRFVS